MVAFDFESKIASIPDYPEPGVVFKDITPLLADGEGFSAVIDAIADHFKDAGVTKVVGAEATGGTAVAQIRLVQKFGARLAGLGFLMELEFLEPRTCISRATDADVFSLVKVG